MKLKTTGVCSRYIEVRLDGNSIQEVNVIGGCPGNALGIAALLQGMDADEAIRRLEGIKCGDKRTSCPDQIAKALREAKNGE